MRTEHVERTYSFDLEIPAAESFALFDPIGEARWVDGWEPVILYRPPDGWAGAAFRTEVNGEETLWLVVDYDRSLLRVRYARITPGSRAGFVTVQCADAEAKTRVTVTYELTSLSDAGAAWLAGFTESEYRRMIDGWQRDIRRALLTLAE